MRFTAFISEAPIVIDMSPYKTKLKRILARRKNPISYDSIGLIDVLNNEFKPERIFFEIMIGKTTRDLIQGSIDRKTLQIYIEVGLLRLANDSTEALIRRFIEAMEHELVHREQSTRSGGKLKYTEPPGNDEEDLRAYNKYFADKSEIMAYAIESIRILRHEGYKDDQIIDMLRRPAELDSKIGKSQSLLYDYIMMFGTKSPQYKKLSKYMMQYLEKKNAV
jgi:hypothetical protein